MSVLDMCLTLLCKMSPSYPSMKDLVQSGPTWARAYIQGLTSLAISTTRAEQVIDFVLGELFLFHMLPPRTMFGV